MDETDDRKTILVVDDDPEIIHLFTKGIQPQHEVMTATTGSIALEIARNHIPDLILLDIMMPTMDGYEVCRQLQKNDSTRQIPLIFISAHTTREALEKGLQLGAFFYLAKPVDPAALRAIITTALERFSTIQTMRQEVRRTANTLTLLDHGRFSFRTLDEARHLAALLAKSCPEPEHKTRGLSELLVNAVEHGNLGITYQEKGRMNRQNSWRQEVEHRLTLPENAHKKVTVTFTRKAEAIHILIQDDGPGFDWKPYLEIDPERLFDSNGRGIAMAKQLSFNNIEYLGTGNTIQVVIANPKPTAAEETIPLRSPPFPV